LKVELIRVDELAASQGEAMIGLFQEHFEGVSRDRFHHDLDEKGWAILITEDDGALRGFTTLDIYDVGVGRETTSVVYSGDTIVHESTRGTTLLSSAWIGAVNRLRGELGKDRLWWLLLASGFRTYRFLPTFWRTFWPHHAETTPPARQKLLDSLAKERFGDEFDEERGIVRLEYPQILRAGFRGIPGRRMRDPHVAFFAERNPAHERGDELVCLTELANDNLTRAGRRMWDAGEKLFAPRATRP
jgi:hypothetical protein